MGLKSGMGSQRTDYYLQWKLHHLQKQQIPAQLFENTPHHKLMHACTEEEGDESGRVLVDLHRGDGGMVDMSEEEVVNWPVPVASKLIPGDAIPPVCVKSTIRKIREFGEEI